MKDLHTNNPLDQKVREKLYGMEVTPPPGAWEGLEARLDAQEPPVAKKRYALLLLIPLVALIGTGVYYWQSGTPDAADTAVPTEHSAMKSETSATAGKATDDIAGNAVTTEAEATAATPAKPAANSSGIASGSSRNAQAAADRSQRSTTATTRSAARNTASPTASVPVEELAHNEVALVKMPARMVPLNLDLANKLDEEYPDEKESLFNPRIYRPRLGWSIEMAFTPAFTHRFIQQSNDPTEEIPNQVQVKDNALIDYRNDMEKPGLGYSFDLKVSKRLNEKWIIRSGVSYVRMKSGAQKTAEFDEPQSLSNDSMIVLNVEQNLVQGATSRNFTSTAYTAQVNEYEYVVVPVTVQYERGFGALRFYMGAGASVDYLVKARSEILDNYSWPIGNDRSLSQLPRLNYSMILNAGIGYEILPHLTLTGEPTYRFSLKSILPDGTSIQQYPYLLGFSTGVKYEF